MMLTNFDVADVLVVFKEDNLEKGVFSDEPAQFVWLVGEKIDAVDHLVYIFHDICGYEWQVPATSIGTDKEYDWLKKCYQRILDGETARR